MKKGWIVTLLLFGFFFVVQQSTVFSQKTDKTVLLAQSWFTAATKYSTASYSDVAYTCTQAEIQDGWAKLTSGSLSSKTAYINTCITDTNHTVNWCCICFTNRVATPPEICSVLYAYLTGTPMPKEKPTEAPVNCVWEWSTCSQPVCGPGIKTVVITTPASNGGTCDAPTKPQSCPIIEYCPINCSYSGWSTCYNVNGCGTGTQYMLKLTPAAYSGKDCDPSAVTSPRSCELGECPIDCVWSEWSACSTANTCGYGKITRTIKTANNSKGVPCSGSSESACIIKQCSDAGTGGAQSGSTVTSADSTIIFLTTEITPTPKIFKPTFTPVPPSPTPTKKPTPSPTIFEGRGSTPIPHPTITLRPTTTPTIPPTPTLLPPSPTPSPFIPGSLTNQQTASNEKTVITLNTAALKDIKISSNTTASEKNKPTEKPLLPQEQQSQQQVSGGGGGGGGGGILVSLEQNVGGTVVTRQDSITVKRGNQFFTITNQAETKNTQTNQSNDPALNTSAPRLEINANNVIAQSSMSLSVDPLSGILTVDSPTGPQRVTIMPDEALGIIMELKALNSSGVIETSILLVSEKGSLIYRISGSKVEKFLGLVPLAIQKQILVSADTGSVVKVELSLISRILSYFTF